MITLDLVDAFLRRAGGPALRDGTAYAHEARVGHFAGDAQEVTTVVRGRTGDFEVQLSSAGNGLSAWCACPSWRIPCKHAVAAALVLRQWLRRGEVPETQAPRAPGGAPRRGNAGGAALPAERGVPPRREDDPEAARVRALEERRLAARREKLTVTAGPPPFVTVASASGFRYLVHLRGVAGATAGSSAGLAGIDADGPHGCDCPDFEANRLHTCKHVERVRALLRSEGGPKRDGPRGATLSAAHRAAAARPRVYLHLGDAVEPRLLGTPRGPGSRVVRAVFDAAGRPVRRFATDEAGLLRQLEAFGAFLEPEARAWLAERAARRPVLPAVPFARLVPPLRLEPYPFQWEGAEFLARAGRALLADEMGLGKTVQAILAALALRRAGAPAAAVTIVCPASLRGGWQDEIAKWTGEGATLLEGGPVDRARAIAARPAWLITHYEQVRRDFPHHGAARPDLLIIDEAQRAKGLAARTARVLKAIDARYVFALTGTPLENRLEEAYAIAQLIDQRLLPPLWQLDRDHFVRDPKGRRVVAYSGLSALRARLAPAFLRRRKEDVALQLPERVRATALVPLHPAVVDTYDSKMAQVARIASKKVILPADMDRMQRLLVVARRCCDGPHMLGEDAENQDIPKLRELEQVLLELCAGEGRKTVVFSEWTDMTERVVALADGLRLPVFHLHGDVPVAKRPALIRAFTEQDGPAVFVSTDAGGVGLNLQAADAVINLDLPWNPARLEQRIARVHRIGSRRTVRVLLLVAEHTLEQRILALHDTKRAVLANVWSTAGEDTIAAPGGSGAFREMVQELLRTRGPADVGPAPEPVVPAPGSIAPARGPVVSPPVPVAPARGPVVSPPVPVVPAREPVVPAREPGLSAPGSIAPARETAVSAPGAVAAVVTSPPPAAAGVPGGAASASAVLPGALDPGLVAATVAALLPAIPEDHRRSLSAVFRALADALAGGRTGAPG